MTFSSPLNQIWHLFIYDPFNSNTHLRVRLWIRVR